MYYITTDLGVEVDFDESDFYDHLEALHVDYVKNMSVQESEDPIRWLDQMLTKLGAAIGYHKELKDGGFACCFRFEDAEKMKAAYFGPKLMKLKEEAEKLTLFELLHRAPELDRIIDDPYDDRVIFRDAADESMFTKDAFIREIKSGVTYYLYEKVILLH